MKFIPLEWCIFHIFPREDIDDFTDIKDVRAQKFPRTDFLKILTAGRE